MTKAAGSGALPDPIPARADGSGSDGDLTAEMLAASRQELDELDAKRRERLGIELSRYLPWTLMLGATVLAGLWSVARSYVQLAWYSAILVANAAIVALSGRLLRQGRRGLGEFLFVASFTLHLSAVPLILPETLLEMTSGYALVLLLAGLVVGARNMWMVASFCVPALVADVVLGPGFHARFLEPIPPATGHVVSVVMMAFQMALDAYLLFLVLRGQEDLYREARRMTLRAELMQKQSERAQEAAEGANRAKGAFLATMSHEIRTPMNAVIGMTSLLMDSDLSPAQREFARTIRASGEALLTVINDILDFSKIEAGRVELDERPFDLRECVEGAMTLLSSGATEKGLDVACDVAADVPTVLIGDDARLRQILLNLLGNAVKFTAQGEVVVTVTQEGKSEDGRTRLHFTVRDTGVGIAPELQGRLFQSFSQVDSSTTRRFGGTGLGLAISQRLSELMGGRMWVESRGVPGEGSTFHFTTLMARSDVVLPAFLEPVQVELRGRRVLVVDDNATNRRIVTLQVETWGMKAEALEHPREALARLAQGGAFDVALLDGHMPDLDGIALAEQIRALPGAAGKLPLILLSSVGSDTASRHLFAAAMNKPVRASQLYDALMSIFSSRKAAVAPEAALQSPFDPNLGTSWPLRILLAEDHATNQQLALLTLARLGYRADLAANGLEVLAALERQTYDVVLMDMQMPEMDGLEATRRVRETWPGDLGPRIVAMTANVTPEDREACREAGMDDYLSKPIRVEGLVVALKACKPLAERAPASSKAGEAAGGDGVTHLDPSAIDQLRLLVNGDLATLGQLVQSYLDETPKLIATLSSGLEKKDAPTVRRGAHSIKSTSRDFGATRLAELGATLEAKAKVAAWDGVPELVAAIETEWVAARSALTAAREGWR